MNNTRCTATPVAFPIAGPRWWCGAFALMISWGSQAQPAPVLSMKDAAQVAVSNSPEVLAKWHTLKSSSGERDAAAGGFLPRLDVNAAAGQDRRSDSIFRGSVNRSSNSISLTQLLYDGFATSNDVRRLDHTRMVRLYEFFDTSESVALEAARAYVDVLRYRELVKLAEDNYIQHRSVFRQTERRVKARVARGVDLEQISARLALAESNLLTETSNLHDTTARFQRVVGTMPTVEMPVPAQLTKGIPLDAVSAIGQAQLHNAALLASIESVRASSAALDSRSGAFGPRIDLRLRRDRGSNSGGYPGTVDINTAEVVLNWNLFSGGSDRARSRQFAEQLNVVKDLRDKTCRDTRQTLLIAYNDVRKIREQIGYLDQNKVSIEKARNAYRLQFDIGQRTLLDLLDTENELFQSRRSAVNAEQDLSLAYVRTHAALGTLLSALELSKLDTGDLKAPSNNDGADDVSAQCPQEAVMLYTVDKDALNARADEQLRQTALTNARERALQEPASGGVIALPSPQITAQRPLISPDAGTFPAPSAANRELEKALEAWRSAWAARDVENYLASYAPGDSPSGSGDRKDWERSRRALVGRSSEIFIEVSDVSVSLPDATHAVTVFTQVYRSGSYRDTVRKTLNWTLVNGRWLVTREVSARAAR
jgi:outer membrane protein, adhesin transport system